MMPHREEGRIEKKEERPPQLTLGKGHQPGDFQITAHVLDHLSHRPNSSEEKPAVINIVSMETKK